MNGLSPTRVLAVLAKEFTQLRRDRLTYAMILLIPIGQLLLFGYAINDDPHHLPTAVFVQDQGVFARSALAALQNTSYFDVDRVAHSTHELDRMLARGDVQFAITIPADFSERVLRHDNPQILVEADATDPSSTGGALAAAAALPASALEHDLVGAAAPAPNAGGAPFQVIVHRRYNPANITAYNIVPGLLGVVLSLTLVMMTALGVTRERERGTMESLLATPVRPLEVMIGKLSPYVLVGLIQTAVILTVAKALFAVPMTANAAGWTALGLGTVLFITGSLVLGFLISTLATNQLQAMQMSFFYMLPSILLSGFAFPFRGMPGWAQAVGSALPVTYYLRIVRGALLKDLVPADLGPNLMALLLFACAAGVLAMARYRRTLD
ncbi:MAG TPA: ABC transporter permease [Caulobacteraceae bacterium]|nr:ABC transporter permease [Caulobacteraceae bacterium]